MYVNYSGVVSQFILMHKIVGTISIICKYMNAMVEYWNRALAAIPCAIGGGGGAQAPLVEK